MALSEPQAQEPPIDSPPSIDSTSDEVSTAPPPIIVSELSEDGRTRPISLEEAIQLALENNFDIRIQRREPALFGYSLAESYAVYEPSLSLSAFHNFRTQPGGTDAQGRSLPQTEAEDDSFSGSLGPGLSGYLPTGLRYELSAGATDSLFRNPRAGLDAQNFSSYAQVRLSQPLLRDFWIDASRYQIALNKNALKVSEWAFRRQLMTSLAQVEQAYYNLIFARENVKVQQKALELVERLLVENRKRVEVGSMAPLDEQQAKSQVAASRAQLFDAERALNAQENTLKSLITDRFSEWHDLTLVPVENLVALPVDFDLQESWRKGVENRPAMHQAELALDREDLDMRFARNQLFPSLNLEGSYGFSGLSDGVDASYANTFDNLASGRNPRYSYGVVLRVPLGNRAARNRYKSAKVEKEQVELQLEQIEQQILVEIADAVRLAQASLQRVASTREARLFAEAALEAEQKKLANGKSTSFFVLQFQRDLTAARFEEIRALAEYNNALTQLAFSEGVTLERHGIDLDLR